MCFSSTKSFISPFHFSVFRTIVLALYISIIYSLLFPFSLSSTLTSFGLCLFRHVIMTYISTYAVSRLFLKYYYVIVGVISNKHKSERLILRDCMRNSSVYVILVKTRILVSFLSSNCFD